MTMDSIPTVGSSRPARRPRIWQLGLRTFLLLVGIIAVWVTHINNLHEISTLRTQIAAASALTRELVIEDASKIAVVKLDELWYDENQWHIHLPPGKFQLKMATREIDTSNFPAPQQTASLISGKRLIALEQTFNMGKWHAVALVDNNVVLDVVEPNEWYPGVGSTGGGSFSRSTQIDPKEKIVLFRRRFSKTRNDRQTRTPEGPTEGVLLWVERQE